jgi:hypothetical protein
VSFVTASGHGFPARFTGQGRLSLWEVGHYQASEVAGKIVHLLACESARNLGVDVVEKGCRAFFGYDAVFIFPDTASELFLQCDAQIDIKLAEGRSAGEAYEAAIQAFNQRIALMLKAGKTWIAAALQRNRDHLCAPSVDPKWGDRNASL